MISNNPFNTPKFKIICALASVFSLPVIFMQKLKPVDHGDTGQYCGEFCFEDWGQSGRIRRIYGSVQCSKLIPSHIRHISEHWCWSSSSLSRWRWSFSATPLFPFVWAKWEKTNKYIKSKLELNLITGKVFMNQYNYQLCLWFSYFEFTRCFLTIWGYVSSDIHPHILHIHFFTLGRITIVYPSSIFYAVSYCPLLRVSICATKSQRKIRRNARGNRRWAPSETPPPKDVSAQIECEILTELMNYLLVNIFILQVHCYGYRFFSQVIFCILNFHLIFGVLKWDIHTNPKG